MFECILIELFSKDCNYIVGNNVGLLANAHLARADTERDGIFSDVCMSLAKKYAIALDFPKTGIIEKIDWFANNLLFSYIYCDSYDSQGREAIHLSRFYGKVRKKEDPIVAKNFGTVVQTLRSNWVSNDFQ